MPAINDRSALVVEARQLGVAVVLDLYARGGHWRCTLPSRFSTWACREVAGHVAQCLQADYDQVLVAVVDAYAEVTT
ncbi:MAG: hypothetical protein ACLQT7_04830 [Candidatus Dormibacteria bacterium]